MRLSHSGDVSVFLDDHVGGMDLGRALAEISPERRAYALRYRFERDRRLSVAVYLLLKEALRREFGLEGNPRLAYADGGKPYLADHPAIHFSFSHCEKAAVCAVSRRPVGVDVETVTPVDEAVAARVLSASELADVRAVPEPEVAFARLWTRKEALVKLRGTGLDDGQLPRLLETAQGVSFGTTVNRERGYVLSTVHLHLIPTPGDPSFLV